MSRTGSLVLRALKGPDIVEKSKRTKIFRVGDGIAGQVAKTGEAIIANKGYDDPRFVIRDEHKQEDYEVKNLLCVPMLSNEKVTGVVNITNKKHNKDYDDDDLGLITTVATQIAVIIERSRLHTLAITGRPLPSSIYTGISRYVLMKKFFALRDTAISLLL